MREPHFWRDLDPRSRAAAPLTRFLLSPAAALYAHMGARRIARAEPLDCGIPVVCVGNLTLGGAGKTPVVSALRARLSAGGLRAASLSRGYGGELKGPLRVSPDEHTAGMVGDEPLMLASGGESWIARDRAAGALAMKADGVEAIIMDDGHQNPALSKTVSIVVVDAAEPFGNRHVFPKGPLREPIAAGLSRAHGVVLMGDGAVPAEVAASGLPVWRGRLAPDNALAGGAYVAFAGIGRPERFFDSLRQLAGVELSETVPFADHHVYSAGDLRYLRKLAEERGARLVTTSKDHVRLGKAFGAGVDVARVSVAFDNPDAVDAICEPILRAGRSG